MQTIIKTIAVLLFYFITSAPLSAQAKLVHNTLGEMDASFGKLELHLIRTWGGEQEEDEHKFFDTPENMVINNENQVFICDSSNDCIQMFDETGKYLRTIGRRGRGPGDLLCPINISFHHKSGLWVMESMGRRVQCFDINGKSKAIYKLNDFYYWLGLNSKNEIAIYGKENSIKSKRLLTVRNDKWELQREIGVYHDNSVSTLTAESILFSIDSQDNYIAANVKTPVIRKYSRDGKLLKAITFETPYNLPLKVTLNEQGDEIKRLGEFKEEQSYSVVKKGSNVTIEPDSGKAHRKPTSCYALTTDSQSRIYIAVFKRMLTMKERKEGTIGMMGGKTIRKYTNTEIFDNKDIIRLFVFSPEGKILAQAKIPGFYQRLYIHGDRLFVIDGNYNQQIQEYKMIFKTET